MSVFKACLASVLMIALALAAAQPVQAIAKLRDAEAVNVAIKYGIQNKDGGIASVLGPNWIEGEDGSLLNIYTPFMLIATMASKKGVEGTSKKEVDGVRKRLARVLGQLMDQRTPQQVKFSVAMYGDQPDFGTRYKAVIEGEGRGKTVRLNPVRAIPDKIANQNEDGNLFEAINAYYFNYNDLENLETFRLILKSPDGEKIFAVDNRKIY